MGIEKIPCLFHSRGIHSNWSPQPEAARAHPSTHTPPEDPFEGVHMSSFVAKRETVHVSVRGWLEGRGPTPELALQDLLRQEGAQTPPKSSSPWAGEGPLPHCQTHGCNQLALWYIESRDGPWVRRYRCHHHRQLGAPYHATEYALKLPDDTKRVYGIPVEGRRKAHKCDSPGCLREASWVRKDGAPLLSDGGTRWNRRYVCVFHRERCGRDAYQRV